MPITQVDIDSAEDLINELLGNQDAAEEYSKDPEGWLQDNGYGNVSPEAVQQCAVTHSAAAGGAGAGGLAHAYTAAAAPSAGAAGVAAALDPVVYNHYYNVDNSVDNSITNNIVNNGNLDFDQTVDAVVRLVHETIS